MVNSSRGLAAVPWDVDGTHIEGALAVGPGLHERQGWQPTLRVQNHPRESVGLEELEA